jgi:hypothetical protein
MLALPRARDLFGEDGTMQEATTRERIRRLLEGLVTWTQRLSVDRGR